MTAGGSSRTTRRRHGLTQKQLAIRARTPRRRSRASSATSSPPPSRPSPSSCGSMDEARPPDAREVDWGHDLTLVRGTSTCRSGIVSARVAWSSSLPRTPAWHMTDAELDPGPIFSVLEKHGVDFVVIGGLADSLTGRGIRPTTQTSRTPERGKTSNASHALQELRAKLGRADVPFVLDAVSIANGSNLTFDTSSAPSTSSATRLVPRSTKRFGQAVSRPRSSESRSVGVARPPDRDEEAAGGPRSPRRERVPRHLRRAPPATGRATG